MSDDEKTIETPYDEEEVEVEEDVDVDVEDDVDGEEVEKEENEEEGVSLALDEGEEDLKGEADEEPKEVDDNDENKVKEEADPDAEGDSSKTAEPGQDASKHEVDVVEGMEGEIMRARRADLAIQFNLKKSPNAKRGQRFNVAHAFPGSLYVNGGPLLLDAVPSPQDLAYLFPKGMKVRFNARKDQPKHRSAGPVRWGQAEYIVTEMWVGSDTPDFEGLKTGADLAALEEQFNERLAVCAEKSLKSDPNKWKKWYHLKGVDLDKEKWFLKAACGLSNPKRSLPHPDMVERETPGAVTTSEGRVAEIWKPDGGIVELNDDGTRVFFHRTRVFLEGKRLSLAEDLSEAFTIDTDVTVEYVPNVVEDDLEGSDRHFDLEDCEQVALLMYVGERPQIPESIFTHCKRDLAKGEKPAKRYIAQILAFDEPNEQGFVESGVAEILSFSDKNPPSESPAVKDTVQLTPTVKKARFHRDNLFHIGQHLGKVDLRYVFSPYAHGMGTIYGDLVKLETEVEHDGEKITHEFSVGWKGPKVLNSTNLAPTVCADSLLGPRIQTLGGVKFMDGYGWTVREYEDFLDGDCPPFGQFKVGEEVITDYVGARVVDLKNRMQFNKDDHVAAQLLAVVETGEKAGDKLKIDRKVVSLFGVDLHKTEMRYVVEENEVIYVKIKYVEEKGSSKKVTIPEAILGYPGHSNRDQDKPIVLEDAKKSLEEVISMDRTRFGVFLDIHNISLAKIESVIRCESDTKIDLPIVAFPREESKGTVVMLERRPGNNKNEKDGSNGGVIQVRSGPLHGKLVYFSRRILYINGFNMGKCDLTRVINRGCSVTVECIPQRDANNTKTTYNDQPVPYMATLVWGGRAAKGRPRNLEPKPTVSIDGGPGHKWKQFLQEKGMTRKEFLQFVAGEGPVIPKSVFLTAKSGIFHEREMKEAIQKGIRTEKGSENGAAAKDGQESKNLLVYRHGLSAAELCDRALDITGPNDSRIPQLISSDADAQMAFHLQKTFAAAIDNYKTKKDLRVSQVWSQPIAGSNMPNMALLNGFSSGASPFGHGSGGFNSSFGNSSFNGSNNSFSNGSGGGGYNSQKYNKKSYASSNGGSGQRSDWGNRGEKRKSDGGGNNDGSGRKRRRRRN